MALTIVTGVLAALVLLGAVWVVTLRNLFRAALSLGVVLLGVAGIFVLLGAEFLAFVQILVYVGAILVLVVFAIMLTARLHATPSSRRSAAALVASAGLFLVLAASTVPLAQAPAVEPAPLSMLGQQLVTTLVLPFEVISLVLVAALVGAVAIVAGRRSPGSPASGRARSESAQP